jgi:enoyl-CoA hydratase
MTYENVTLTKDNGLAVLAINRRQVRNALDQATWKEIHQALDEVAADEAVQVLILTGDMIGAAEAHRIGLVNQVVPQDELMEAATGMAEKIMRRGPVAVRLAKAAVNAGMEFGPGAGYAFERLAQTVLFGTEDRIEGIDAFLEKRSLEYKGR